MTEHAIYRYFSIQHKYYRYDVLYYFDRKTWVVIDQNLNELGHVFWPSKTPTITRAALVLRDILRARRQGLDAFYFLMLDRLVPRSEEYHEERKLKVNTKYDTLRRDITRKRGEIQSTRRGYYN